VWIHEAQAGCDSAASSLWVRYHRKMMELARLRLNGAARRVADEEDVVVAAFQSFLCRTRKGGYPQLRSRGELWKLLATITAHKALNLIRNEKSAKRGGGRHVGEPLAADEAHSIIEATLANLASVEPSPEFLVMMADSYDHLLSALRDDELRAIARAKLQGMSNDEIAQQVQRSVPTVERRLRLIRDAWRQELLD
jgi:DNA-directed RNA polymerase specialized sigma24 family protein